MDPRGEIDLLNMAQEEAEISILVRVVEGPYQRAQGVVAQFCLILFMVQEEAGL